MTPRVRLRTLVIAVAAVAVGLGVGVMLWRAAEFRARAAEHAWYEAGSRAYADDHAGDPSDFARQAVERGELLEAYHARLRAKYEDAARRPWRTVAPDPPMP